MEEPGVFASGGTFPVGEVRFCNYAYGSSSKNLSETQLLMLTLFQVPGYQKNEHTQTHLATRPLASRPFQEVAKVGPALAKR